MAKRRAKRSPGGAAAGQRGRGVSGIIAFAIVAMSVWAYSSSFGGALMHDDIDALVGNANMRSLWPITTAMTAPRDTPLAGRPIPTLTFAINYAMAPPGIRDALVPGP